MANASFNVLLFACRNGRVEGGFLECHAEPENRPYDTRNAQKKFPICFCRELFNPFYHKCRRALTSARRRPAMRSVANRTQHQRRNCRGDGKKELLAQLPFTCPVNAVVANLERSKGGAQYRQTPAKVPTNGWFDYWCKTMHGRIG